MSPGPIIDAAADGAADQQLPSVDETTLKNKPLPQEEDDAPIVEDDNDDDKDESEDEEDDESPQGRTAIPF